jgi:hypothetical protein
METMTMEAEGNTSWVRNDRSSFELASRSLREPIAMRPIYHAAVSL